MSARPRLATVGPWAGLIAGPIAWVLLQQGSGALIYFACDGYGPGPAAAAGLGALAVCTAGAWLSWRAAPGADRARRLVALAGAGVAGISGFGVVLMTLAVLIGAPPCAR